MKKLFHLSLIVLIVFSVTSCSKSVNDLKPNDKATVTEATQNAGTSKFANPVVNLVPEPVVIPGQQSYIHNMINQPHVQKLGDPKGSIIRANGDYIVFYVIVSPDYMPEPSNKSSLIFKNAKSEEFLLSTDLISYEEADKYEIEVPGELTGQIYMFAKIKLGTFDEYAGRYISLQSEINVDPAGVPGSVAKMDYAFVYMP